MAARIKRDDLLCVCLVVRCQRGRLAEHVVTDVFTDDGAVC